MKNLYSKVFFVISFIIAAAAIAAPNKMIRAKAPFTSKFIHRLPLCIDKKWGLDEVTIDKLLQEIETSKVVIRDGKDDSNDALFAGLQGA